jgi:myo-inositol 2-dehydrogenase / D-chiro-inositol 1-dehydrogenase
MSKQSSYSRRNFLQRSGAAAAAAWAVPWWVPASALGLGEKAAPSNRITVGMIGLGRQAVTMNLPFFLEAPDAQVVALCDVDRFRRDLSEDRPLVVNNRPRKWATGSLQGCSRHTDFREVLARQDVDAVMISTPDHWHVAIALAAVKAGKDIACEKPIGLCVAHGRMLADAVINSKGVFRTDSEFRSIETFHRAVELVVNGRIGKLHTIRTAVPSFDDERVPQQPTMPVPEDLDFDMWLGPAAEAPYTEKRVHPARGYNDRPGWFNIRDYCDGMICNWGYHVNDIAQWGNGTDRSGPVEIEGSGEFLPATDLWNVLEKFDVRYRYANGVQLFYTGLPRKSRPGAYVRFEGSEGWIQANYGPQSLEAEPKSLLTATLGPDAKRFVFKHEKRDFLDCVKSRGQTLEDAEVGHRSSCIGQLGYIAVQVGQKLKWDPAAERFLGNDAANALLDHGPGRAPWSISKGV